MRLPLIRQRFALRRLPYLKAHRKAQQRMHMAIIGMCICISISQKYFMTGSPFRVYRG